MNSREAKPYSNHTTMSQHDRKYWHWSFDEIGRKDAAATIDLVLNATGSTKLTILAFSQGVAASLVLLSTRPEYNDKVNLLVGYGPVGNITYMEPPFSLLMPLLPLLVPIVEPFTDAGFYGTGDGMRHFLSAACKMFKGELCSLTFTLTAFSSPSQLNATREPMYMGHMPIGTSMQNVRHYSQVYQAKNFVMYDHGALENMKRYGKTKPPPYPLERIRLPVALFSSLGDTVADKKDVEDLVARLGSNVVLHHVVSQEDFRHLDFATGYMANEILHDIAIETIRKYAT
ncbi:tear acid lipase-like protein [Amblyomma americanum]